MKRKFIAMGVSVVSILALASCFNNKAKADYSTTRQVTAIDDEIKTEFNLFYDTDLTNAELLDTEAKEGSYYDLYVSKNAKDSLFAYSYNLTDYFSSSEGSRNHTVTVNTLSFQIQDKEALYDEEKTVYILYFISDIDVGHKNRFMSAKGVGGWLADQVSPAYHEPDVNYEGDDE